MRKLSDSFVTALQSGFLRGITDLAQRDSDIDLQIRENYLNLYFKGNSLLNLREVNGQRYRVQIHPKLQGELLIDDIVDEVTAADFFAKVPLLKENIIRYGSTSLEVEYEQLLIRANNFETRNTSEYFIVDRQYVIDPANRFDLTGVFWDRNKRRSGQVISPCFMEAKFALNPDIGRIDQQMSRYYQAILDRGSEQIADEIETLFHQKLTLGLFKQPAKRIETMKTLSISRNLDQFQFILILIDYNPNSRLFQPTALRALPFAAQIKIFQTGFGMWQQNVHTLA